MHTTSLGRRFDPRVSPGDCPRQEAAMSQRNAVYPATVLQARDPRGLGRLQISVSAFDQKVWARRATLLAGERRGTWFVPDAGDEVLVAFEGGDARKPVVVGALWNAKERPPESNPERSTARRSSSTTEWARSKSRTRTATPSSSRRTA